MASLGRLRCRPSGCRGGAKFAQIGDPGRCATPKPGTFFRGCVSLGLCLPGRRHRVEHAVRASSTRHACAECMRKIFGKNAFFFSRFALPIVHARAMRERTRIRSGVSMEDRGRPAAPDFFAKLLTLEKSVIRFRPSRTFLRKQVSRVIATKRTTKRPAARTLTKQYAGLASPEKTPNRIQRSTRAVRVAGVLAFVEGRAFVKGHVSAPTESVAARLARRRLPPGPTPAAFFATGP